MTQLVPPVAASHPGIESRQLPGVQAQGCAWRTAWRRIAARAVVVLSLSVVGVVGPVAAAEPPQRAVAPPAVDAATTRAEFQALLPVLRDALGSAHLRVRMLAGGHIDVADGGPTAATVIPVDTLADDARGSTDPLVLSLLVDLCGNQRLHPQPTCDPVQIARRWTAADTQNQVAWLTLASTLRLHGDPGGARTAFERGAHASVWHELSDEGSRTALAHLPRSLPARVRLAALQMALVESAARLVPSDALLTLSFHCKDPTLRKACRHIVDTIDRDAGSLVSARLGLAIGRNIGVDPQTDASRSAKLDALFDAAAQDVVRDWTEIDDAEEIRAAIVTIERRAAAGQMQSLRDARLRSGLGDGAAALRHRATLEKLQASAGTVPAEPMIESR